MSNDPWMDALTKISVAAQMFIYEVDCGYIPINGSEMQFSVDAMREAINHKEALTNQLLEEIRQQREARQPMIKRESA